MFTVSTDDTRSSVVLFITVNHIKFPVHVGKYSLFKNNCITSDLMQTQEVNNINSHIIIYANIYIIITYIMRTSSLKGFRRFNCSASPEQPNTTAGCYHSPSYVNYNARCLR